MGIDLPLIWFVIIVFSTMMYVVMDGFDLGIGILFPLVKNSRDRDLMMNSVAPVWDGNETWLVLGGAALLGAFPLAYAVILDALAIPLTLMLMALIFRGVAFEFRFKAPFEKQPIWDKAFIGGSLVATFTQGIVIGAFIHGFPVIGRRYSGGPFDWFTPFALFCGVGLVIAYALLGCTWLIMKTEGHLQQVMHKLATPLTLLMLLIIAIISLWTPLSHPQIAARWFTLPNLFWFLPVPLLVLVASWALLRSVRQAGHYAPLLAHPIIGLPRLQRVRDQCVALYHSTSGNVMASRRACAKSRVHVGRHTLYYPHHLGLHLLELLRIPRKNQS